MTLPDGTYHLVSTDAREQYERNLVRLAELDRQLAAYHRLRDALRAHRADPCNVTWRGVLEALRQVEETNNETNS